jgi:DNA-binding NtrC family response regulator
MDDALAKVAQARRATEINVLITGQTGAGKDVVARAISRRSEGVPFVAVNCGGFSPEIVESQLFGYAKGAFTGAARDTRGFFDEANGGDLFLDEVARLSSKAQAALLRVLESGEFHPVGSTTIRTVKVRAIAATNEDLDQAVRDGRFREDLLARLRVITIAVPPLCERREDIRPIIDQVIAASVRPAAHLTPECLAILEAHSWPTNVRGLRGVIASMIALSASDLLDVSDIPPDVWSASDAEPVRTGASVASLTPILGHVEVPTSLSFERGLELFQIRFIEAKLAALPRPRTVTSLATALGIPRTTLIRRLRELNIEVDADAATLKQTGGI